MSDTSRVFITHSSLDQPLAEALVEALRLGANLPEDRIFCSSVEGLGIPTGAEFLHYIREQLQDTDLVVPLITPGNLDSMFCAYELGAAWVRDVAMFPLAVPPVPRAGLPGPLGAKQVAAFGKGGLNECLKVVIARTAGAKQSSRWEKHRDQLLSIFDELQPELATAWATTLLALQRRAARHAAAAPHIHEVFHLIRDAAFLRVVAGDRADLRSLLAHLHRIAVATETVFSRTTDTPCRVTIKQLQLEHDVLQVFDLKRSQGKSRRHVIDRVEDNSDFEAICSGSVAFFFSNDLPALAAEGIYENSHAVPGEALPYSSTIVWPIRKVLDDPSDAMTLKTLVEDQDILGFLCVDAKKKGAFSENDTQLGAAIADTLYALLKPYIFAPEDGGA